MRTVLTCLHCGAVTGRSQEAPALLANHHKNHAKLEECVAHLRKLIRDLEGKVGDLVDHTGLNETDDPRQNGWVDDKGRP